LDTDGEPLVQRQWLLPSLRADESLINAITVCTRPFRPQGPRVETERLDDTTVVHNYGHGGSGWSLSWGSSAIATGLALATGAREFGVIGCGALGLTSALLLQRAGARVTIYARELPPLVRSSLANGVWTPDSRICLAQHASAAFRAQWQQMARYSWKTYQGYLGLPGAPVEWFDRYTLTDHPASTEPATRAPVDTRPPFASLSAELLSDLYPATVEYLPGQHPLGPRLIQAVPWLLFNLTAYTERLMDEYRSNRGRIDVREFHTCAELAALPEKTLINATGYGARALFGDESLIPVRGQLARMPVQEEIRYGLFYRGTSFIPRRDGLVFQVLGDNDYYGYDDDTVVPDRSEAAFAVRAIAELFAGVDRIQAGGVPPPDESRKGAFPASFGAPRTAK
jgi:FAD dependent oxidoreductase